MPTRYAMQKCVLSAVCLVALSWTADAQSKVQLPSVGPDHAFTGATLPGIWVTLRNEVVNFKSDGSVAYQSAKGESRQGQWSVSSGTIYLTWTDHTPAALIQMTVTAFSNDRIRVQSMAGKAHAEFVRQSTVSGPLTPAVSAVRVPPSASKFSTTISAAATPHLNDHGGPVASNPALHVMYWSGDWDSTSLDPQFHHGNIDNWLSGWLASNYFDKANQYGVHSGTFEDSNQNFFLFPDPGGTTNSLFIHTWATGMIETPGTGVPYPCSDNDVYAVMLPPTTQIDNIFNKTCGSFGAYHLFAPVFVPPFVCGLTDLGGVRFPPYTIIPAQCATHDPGPNGFYTNFDELTMLMTHETIEASTDSIDSFATSIPVIGDIIGAILGILNVDPAWYDDNAGSLFTQSEAGDICESPRNPEVWLNNSLVAAYWSNADNDCAAGPGVARNFSLKQSGVPAGIPVTVSFDSRTLDVNKGGGFTIQVATNTNHTFAYPSPVAGGPGTRYVTSQPPGNVSVTGTFSVTAPYGTEYFVTVNTNPAAAAVGNASLTASDWYDAGSFTLHADQDVAAGSGMRYDFQSWTGGVSASTHDVTFNLTGPITATANYNLQDLVSFGSTGIPSGTPWTVTLDGTPHPGPFLDWVNKGTTIHYSYEQVVPALTPGTCYVLTGVAPPSPQTINAPLTVTGTFVTQAVPQAIMFYQLLGSQSSGGQTTLTYTAKLVNCGAALGSVTARVASFDPNVVPVSGFRTLGFSPVQPNSISTSTDIIKITIPTGSPVNLSALQWTFLTFPPPPQANAGLPQTVPVGTTVTLNGGASINNGGGPLSYAWTFISTPAGSRARLSNPPGVITTFVPDVAGAYVLRLTVTNSAGTSSSDVTITATP